MCFELYIGADVPIPEIDNEYGISTVDVSPDHQINDILSLTYKKYLGSSLGCSCGFREAFWDDEDKVVNLEENPWILETYAVLFEGQKGIFIEGEGMMVTYLLVHEKIEAV